MMISRVIASGCGAGFAPRAPGTCGSLIGLVIGAVIIALGGVLPLIFAIIVVSGAGIWAVEHTGDAGADPGWIVIDEVAGQLIALLALPVLTPLGLLAAFAFFRLFDITKPGPIGWADSHHNEWGVMGDDWIAGAAAAIFLVALRMLTPAGLI